MRNKKKLTAIKIYQVRGDGSAGEMSITYTQRPAWVVILSIYTNIWGKNPLFLKDIDRKKVWS